jgi:hypothetical protein
VVFFSSLVLNYAIELYTTLKGWIISVCQIYYASEAHSILGTTIIHTRLITVHTRIRWYFSLRIYIWVRAL